MRDHPHTSRDNRDRHAPQYSSISGRVISVAAGGALMLSGFRRGGISGALRMFIGMYGVLRGVSGNCARKESKASSDAEAVRQNEENRNGHGTVSRSIIICKHVSEVIDLIKQAQRIGHWVPMFESAEGEDQHTSEMTICKPSPVKQNWCLSLEEVGPGFLRWRTAPGLRWEHQVLIYFIDKLGDQSGNIKIVIVGKPLPGKSCSCSAGSLSSFTDKALLHLLLSIGKNFKAAIVSDHIPFQPTEASV